MTGEPAGEASSATTDLGPMSVFNLGKEQTQAMLSTQKEFLEAYEQANRAWLARVKAETELWSELATKLAGTRSVPDFMRTYQDTVSQRMQMAAEDARRLSEEGGKIMQKITWSLRNGQPAE